MIVGVETLLWDDCRSERRYVWMIERVRDGTLVWLKDDSRYVGMIERVRGGTLG